MAIEAIEGMAAMRDLRGAGKPDVGALSMAGERIARGLSIRVARARARARDPRSGRRMLGASRGAPDERAERAEHDHLLTPCVTRFTQRDDLVSDV